MRKFLFIIPFFLTLSGWCYSQTKQGKILVDATVVGKDTFPVVNLSPYAIEGTLDPQALKALQKLYRLRANIIKVMPYAKMAGERLREIEEHRRTLKTEREKKEYTKTEERKIRDQFEAELRNLTISQGQILIKLIDRETGNTSYHLVKELRGAFQAFFWQGVARVFGQNLKAEYDSTGEDKAIEEIIRSIEREQRR